MPFVAHSTVIGSIHLILDAFVVGADSECESVLLAKGHVFLGKLETYVTLECFRARFRRDNVDLNLCFVGVLSAH